MDYYAADLLAEMSVVLVYFTLLVVMHAPILRGVQIEESGWNFLGLRQGDVARSLLPSFVSVIDYNALT